MIDEMVRFLSEQFGPEWTQDEEANLRFSVEAEFLIRAVDGVHLVGEPRIEGDRITVSIWVDQPIPDLMTADRLAYDIFGRLSEQIFVVERSFDAHSIKYRFVTGTAARGHVGTLEMVGPNAADFAQRQQHRYGGVQFHA